MGESEQLTRSRGEAPEAPLEDFAILDREHAQALGVEIVGERVATTREARDAELAAKRSLKAQISKLDRELSRLVIEGFPHIAARSPVVAPAAAAPCLPSLAKLEAHRDTLVARLREAELATLARAEHERQARELLAKMRLEPGRYRFYKLRAADLGEAGCGVWHVRPRLGPIGMLAGWWQLTLSSGCPLAGGRRAAPARTR